MNQKNALLFASARSLVILTLVFGLSESLSAHAKSSAKPAAPAVGSIAVSIGSKVAMNNEACSNPISENPTFPSPNRVIAGKIDITVITKNISKDHTNALTLKLPVVLWVSVAEPSEAISSRDWHFKGKDGKESTVENRCFSTKQADVQCFTF